MNLARTALLAGTLGLVALPGCDRPADDPPGRVTAPPAPAPAEPAAPAPAPVTEGPAKITFAVDTYDFGRLNEVDKKKGSLEFTNTGGETLVINEIKTSCGCTAATLARMDYAPGERGAIDIEFDPSGPGDDQKKYINVFSNDPGGMVRLMITADVDPFIEIEPRFLQLDVLEYGREHRRTVRVSSRDREFEMARVATSNPQIGYRVIDDVALEDGEKLAKEVELIVPADHPWGSIFTWLEITVRARPRPDAEPISHLARVRVQGQTFGRLRADPEKFRFGAQPGESFERVIRVFHADGAPFELTAAVTESRLASTAVRVEPIDAGVYRLTLTATAPTILGQYGGTVTLTTSVPGEERIELPIEGVVRTEAGGVR